MTNLLFLSADNIYLILDNIVFFFKPILILLNNTIQFHPPQWPTLQAKLFNVTNFSRQNNLKSYINT